MISPNIGNDLAEPVAEIYAEAELRILQRISYQLSQGLDSDEWETLQLGRLQQVRAEVLAELQATNPQAAAAIQSQIDQAYQAGQASAVADVGATLDPLAGQTAARSAAVAVLAADASNKLASTQGPILRAVDDVYRRITADAAADVLTGSLTRREATQRALGRYLGQGLKGIETKRGTMDLTTYTTMALRTATARAAVAGHENTMSDQGLELVLIRPGPRHCPICDKWARKVLTLGRVTGKITVYSATDGTPIEVTVDDTLANARAGGWGHPNCRCNLETWIPGVESITAALGAREPFSQAQYDAQQMQRSNERQIRNWKQRQAIAITPKAQADAADQIKRWQGVQRAHLDEHPYLKRQSAREQIGGQFAGNATRAQRGPGGTTAARTPKSPKTPPQPGSEALRPAAQSGLKAEVTLSPGDKFIKSVTEAKTHEHIADALRERFASTGIKIEGFDKPGFVTVSQARRFASTVHGLLTDYPELTKVGSIGLTPTRSKSTLAFVQYHRNMKDLDSRASINLSTTFVAQDGGHDMDTALEKAAARGWAHLAPGVDGLDYITTHEVGHLLDLATGQVTRGQVKRLRTKFERDSTTDISEYAMSAPAEAVAEAFATARTSPGIATPVEKAIHDYLLGKLDERRKANGNAR